MLSWMLWTLYRLELLENTNQPSGVHSRSDTTFVPCPFDVGILLSFFVFICLTLISFLATLQEYLGILYMKPKMHIYLREKRVRTKQLITELKRVENTGYTPRFLVSGFVFIAIYAHVHMVATLYC